MYSMRYASAMTIPAKPPCKTSDNTTEFPRTELVDEVVTRAAEQYLGDRIDGGAFALLAVGGYGRRELFPCSDVDLLLLLDREVDGKQLQEPLSQFLRVLWDSAVKASHSVHTLDECCRVHANNIHLSISLLDARWLFGSKEVYERLMARLPEFFRRQARALLQGLSELTVARHAKFGNTVYHLEPNIKEAPGGIRDIHFLDWASRIAPDKEPLVHAASNLNRAKAFLYQVRFFLHQQYGRDNNLLSFELQDKAALQLPETPQTPEDWMREYYQHARACYQPAKQAIEFIARAEGGLVRQFLDRRDRLSTSEFTVSHNRLLLRNPSFTLRSAAGAFEVFVFVARHGIPVAWDTERRIRQQLTRFRESAAAEQPAWKEWHSLLSQPHAALALRNMEECGLLDVIFPTWASVESLVVRDFYHRYTVDEHTLVAIESIDKLVTNEDDHQSRFRDLALEDENLALLRMALLLHDVGKGTTPGEHVRGSLEAADGWLSGMGMPETERLTVRFLIEHHLDLSVVMTGRDLDDPATARWLSAMIPTYEDLRKLTLLTYADVSAVNPTAMTPWRAEQLWRVYSLAAGQLTKELASERIHHVRDPKVSKNPELARFLEGFPTRYLRIHTSERIQEHFQLEQARLRKGVAVEIRRDQGAYVLTVLSEDQAGLFASLCGTLASFGMNIVRAEAASNTSGCILDELYFTDPTRTLELNPEEIERLSWTVECVVKGAIQVTDLLKRRRNWSRPHSAAKIPTSIQFDDLASDVSTLLYVNTDDRPGLLFDLASELSDAQCNIELVLVNTEGHRAIDVFYLTRSGTKLDAQLEESLREELLEKA
jgi:[protein-PII] uridylyltransferase